MPIPATELGPGLRALTACHCQEGGPTRGLCPSPRIPTQQMGKPSLCWQMSSDPVSGEKKT